MKVTSCLAGEPIGYDDFILLIREISIISQISRTRSGRKNWHPVREAFLSSVGQPYKKRQPRQKVTKQHSYRPRETRKMLLGNGGESTPVPEVIPTSDTSPPGWSPSYSLNHPPMVTNASSQTQLQILTLVGLQFMHAMDLKAEATRGVWQKRSMNQQVYNGETITPLPIDNPSAILASSRIIQTLWAILSEKLSRSPNHLITIATLLP